jgi:hypothetical protein
MGPPRPVGSNCVYVCIYMYTYTYIRLKLAERWKRRWVRLGPLGVIVTRTPKLFGFRQEIVLHIPITGWYKSESESESESQRLYIFYAAYSGYRCVL